MEDLTCIISKDHLLKEAAKRLPCGSLICLQCLNDLTQRESFSCPCCKKDHSSDLITFSDSELIKSSTSSEQVKQILVQSLKRSIKSLEDSKLNADSCLTDYHEYLKNEVLIRVESMKTELDNLCDMLSNELDIQKEKSKQSVKELSKRIDTELSLANEFIENEKAAANNLCENKIIEVENLESELKGAIQRIKFKACEENILIGLIGEIKDTTDLELIESHEGSVYTYISLEDNVTVFGDETAWTPPNVEVDELNNDYAITDENDDNEVEETGRVMWFDVKKGFGFIRRNRGGKVFFRRWDISKPSHRILYQNQNVKFHIKHCAKGLKAKRVEKF